MNPATPASRAELRRGVGRHLAGFAIALQPLQVRSQFCGRLVTQVPVPFQRLADDVIESFGQDRVALREGYRRLIQNSLENDGGGLPLEGRFSGRHLVQHGAQGKNVGALVQGLAARLLRGCKRWSPPLCRHGHGGNGCRGRFRRRFVRQLRQPEVQHFALAVRSHKNVPRLQVAMNDSAPVRRVQSVSDFQCKPHKFVKRKSTLGQASVSPCKYSKTR
jgi:hypothetical protein